MPPAALAIHLCIGMAYGFSVFWLPLSRAIGITQPSACPDSGFVTALFSTNAGLNAKVLLAWASVVIPLLWGLWITLTKAAALFS